jgi:hypothetical protein
MGTRPKAIAPAPCGPRLCVLSLSADFPHRHCGRWRPYFVARRRLRDQAEAGNRSLSTMIVAVIEKGLRE